MLLKNNDRIETCPRISWSNPHSRSKYNIYLGSTSVMDLHLVIIAVLLITIIAIREHDPVHSQVLFRIQ